MPRYARLGTGERPRMHAIRLPDNAGDAEADGKHNSFGRMHGDLDESVITEFPPKKQIAMQEF